MCEFYKERRDSNGTALKFWEPDGKGRQGMLPWLHTSFSLDLVMKLAHLQKEGESIGVIRVMFSAPEHATV